MSIICSGEGTLERLEGGGGGVEEVREEGEAT